MKTPKTTQEKKPSKLEKMMKEFQMIEPGILIEVTVKNKDSSYSTSGYLSGMEDFHGRRYIVLDRYKSNGPKVHMSSQMRCMINLIESYNVKQ